MIETTLPSVIGQKLYAVGFSHLYKPTSTVEQMSGREEIFARIPITSVPFLEPLTITKAKYFQDINAVVMMVRLPNGAEAIAYTSLEYSQPEKESFLTGISGSLIAKIPEDLTPVETDAIKKVSVARGMSKDALAYAVGFAEKENDWGRGGKQCIYFGGKLIVYLDNSGKVEDWQSFD